MALCLSYRCFTGSLCQTNPFYILDFIGSAQELVESSRNCTKVVIDFDEREGEAVTPSGVGVLNSPMRGPFATSIAALIVLQSYDFCIV